MFCYVTLSFGTLWYVKLSCVTLHLFMLLNNVTLWYAKLLCYAIVC